jgi:FdhE protein
VKRTADTPSRLEETMDRAVKNNPHSKDIIDAFRPVLIEKDRLVSTLESPGGAPLVLDDSRFKEGVPLGGQNNLFSPDDPWKSVALALIPAIAQGFPAMADDLERIRGLLESGSLDLRDEADAEPDQTGELIHEWASTHSIDEQALVFLFHMAERVILEKKARDWGKLLEGFPWDRGYCPVCGAAPMIAKIKEGQSARILICSQCSHEWSFSRVICPSCGNDKQKTMTYFLVADKTQESTFVCEQCRRYLITADRVSDLIDFDAQVCALSLVHLDVVMQEKGYTPMAACEWNTLPQE